MTDIKERPATATAPVAGREDGSPPIETSSPYLGPAAHEHRQRLRRTASGRRHAAFAWLTALVIVAAAVYGGIRLTGYRLAGQTRLALGSATLTASRVSVPTPADGQVVRVYVHPGQDVQAGSKLVRVRLFGASSSGHPSSSLTTVTAPSSGIVSSVPSPKGSGVLRGDPLVEMYDPRSDTFQTPIDPGELGGLRRGMHAVLSSPALPHPIAAVVDHVLQPSTGPAQQDGSPATTATTEGTLILVLRPLHPGALGRLIPGLVVSTVVDTATGSKQAPSLARLSS
jgi:multidrug resistance efflux pump